MYRKLKIGVIREGKTPPDSRVALTPEQCKSLLENYSDIEVYVESSPTRCFHDNEYRAKGVEVTEDIGHCDILLGIKEVPIALLLPNKHYFFFSHTIKKQAHNRALLQSILAKNITLTDYECLRWENTGKRILGFGRYAGIVGAHNGVRDYGLKTKTFELKAAYECKDLTELKSLYQNLTLPPIKIVLTGNGRVANGAQEVVDFLGIKQVSPDDFLTQSYDKAVYTVLRVKDLYRKKADDSFDKQDFYARSQDYYSTFAPYTQVTDLMINGIYWGPTTPIFFTKEDMKNAAFNIKVIADISCDIEGSIPATLRSTKIGDPTFGYDPLTETEVDPYQASNTVDIMAVDNLPNELPRSASLGFGIAFTECIIPELLKQQSTILENATIAQNGQLTEEYKYLTDYVQLN